jgi:hypothetical protein
VYNLQFGYEEYRLLLSPVESLEVGQRVTLAPAGPREEAFMDKPRQESRCADPIERVLTAYDELTKTMSRSEGASIEEIQAAVEYLLDAVKVAAKKAPGLPLRAETLLRAASVSRQYK